jgi:adenylate cyclase
MLPHDLQTPIRDEQRDVTLLFADLRGVTDLAGSMEMDPLFCEMLSHVLDSLTDAVLDNDGYIIDYCGDGLVAMWNAPVRHPKHAELACCAGLQMHVMLPEVTNDWVRLIHTELRLGVGVHTGTVQVGNAGSTKRQKFGARGPNVHVANRVEAATKELGVPLLATQATVEQFSGELAAHRVCRARMPGLRQPVDLYAVGSRETEASQAQEWQTYDAALRQFESGQYQEVANLLSNIDEAESSVPARFLFEQVQRELGRNLRRRSTDKPTAIPNGVIALNTK